MRSGPWPLGLIAASACQLVTVPGGAPACTGARSEPAAPFNALAWSNRCSQTVRLKGLFRGMAFRWGDGWIEVVTLTGLATPAAVRTCADDNQNFTLRKAFVAAQPQARESPDTGVVCGGPLRPRRRRAVPR